MNAHDLLFPEIDGKIDGNPADYNVLLSGMRCLCQWERGRVYDEAMRIDSQIDDVLAELGFNRKKLSEDTAVKGVLTSLMIIQKYFQKIIRWNGEKLLLIRTKSLLKSG